MSEIIEFPNSYVPICVCGKDECETCNPPLQVYTEEENAKNY